jgi:putative spermidine/putrescine transport system ATP-binding protein
VTVPALGEHELVLDHLVRRYGTVTAVNDVSLNVRQGEFVTLLGPSGSGKTTTLMLIAGFLYPASGRIFFRGENITYMPPHLRNVGMVFQNYALFPHMTILDNVAFPLRMRKVPAAEARDRVRAALELVRLGGYEGRMPSQLSGGQQQRIALARALVFEPTLLLMDEPLGALDKYLRERMQLEIKRIQQATGVTIVYVTHDQQEALVLSDRIVVLEGGRVRMDAAPHEVYEHPADSFVAQFIGEMNLLRGPVVRAEAAGCVVRVGRDAEVRVPSGGPDASALVFCVRPERVRCPAGDEPGDNVVSGRVAEVIYLGDVVKYRVVVDGSEPEVSVVAKTLAGAREKPFEPGARVRIGWRPADAWVLPGGPER